MYNEIKKLIAKHGTREGNKTIILLPNDKPVTHRGNICISVGIEDNCPSVINTYWEYMGEGARLDKAFIFQDLLMGIKDEIYTALTRKLGKNYWDRFMALKTECIDDIMKIVEERGGSVEFPTGSGSTELIVGYYDYDNIMSNVCISKIQIGNSNGNDYLKIMCDNGLTVCLDSLHELACISIYEKLVEKKETVCKYGKEWTVVQEFCKGQEDWLAFEAEDGKLYINNMIGVMHFVGNDGEILRCDI